MPTIIDILVDLGIPYEQGRSGWVQLTCPDCGDVSSHGYEKKYLGISTLTNASNCWRCGKKNTAWVLAALSSKPYKEIQARLGGVAKLPMPMRKPGKLVLPGGRGALLPGHALYLQRRGLDPVKMVDLWGIKGIGQASRLKWRIWIPIILHGVVVSWTTRSIKPKERMRYISAGADEEAVPHKNILYGADYARHVIIIHEGPVDVWTTGPGAVATCGTSYTESQVLEMSKFAVRVVCFDAEVEAQQRARALANMLSVFPGTTYNVELETGKDVAEADPGEVAELRKTFLS